MGRRTTKIRFKELLVGVLVMAPLSALSMDISYPDIDVQLVELGPEPLRTGKNFTTLELGSIVPGVSAQKVEARMGEPYARAHREGVMHWDYNVNFPIAGAPNQMVCQYKVVFGENDKVSSTHWRRRNCADLAQALVAPPAAEVQLMTLSANVLFGFGEDTLTSQGRESLREVAQTLLNDYENPAITLVGHADRMGSADYNRLLSKRRAEAVRRNLSQHNLPSAAMVVEGRGATEPVVHCRTDDREKLQLCLQPNRRVDIEVFERGTGARAL